MFQYFCFCFAFVLYLRLFCDGIADKVPAVVVCFDSPQTLTLVENSAQEEYIQSLPQPVIQAVPPGLFALSTMVPGEMLVPLISPVAVTMEMSFGLNPGP